MTSYWETEDDDYNVASARPVHGVPFQHDFFGEPYSQLAISQHEVEPELVRGQRRQQVSSFGPRSLQRYVNRVLQDTVENLNLNGLILYVADYQANQLMLRSGSGHTCSTDKLFSISLPYDASSEPSSFGALVFQTGLPQHSDDSAKDDRFDTDALSTVGVSGAAFGLPLRIGHRCYGSLIAWADRGVLSESTQSQIAAQRNVVTYMIAKAHRDESRYQALASLSELAAMSHRSMSLNSLAGQTMAALTNAGFDRARLFTYDLEKDVFRLVESVDLSGATIYQSSDPRYCNLKYDPDKNFYLDYIFRDIGYYPRFKRPPSNVLSQQRAYLFRTGHFGHDPNADLFDRPEHLPWIVTPLLTERGCIGYISADNRSTQRPIVGENVAYMLAVAHLVSIAASSKTDRFSEDLLRVSKFINPLFLDNFGGASPWTYDWFDGDEGQPVRFQAPGFRRSGEPEMVRGWTFEEVRDGDTRPIVDVLRDIGDGKELSMTEFWDRI